jgi:vanillate/3-O-methylgallate O-demethylase
MDEMFARSPAYPYDPLVGTYQVTTQRFPHPLEYAGWRTESMAWKEGCALFAGIYPVQRGARITGPGVLDLLSYATSSSYDRFAVGKMKHTTVCDDEGRIITHGMVLRLGEKEFQTHTLTPQLNHAAATGRFDVTFRDTTLAEFNFQCTGPRTLELLERASGDCLHDLPFMGHRSSAIDGKPVRIYRMGMAGGLGYEVHGRIEDAQALYGILLEAGKPFGLERMGWLSYAAQLCEAGYPQQMFSFLSSGTFDPKFLGFLRGLGMNTDLWPGSPVLAGSSGTDPKKRYRTPFEVGWSRSVSFQHEFRGKAALEREAAEPRRRIFTLIWNEDDVMDVYRSLFRQGEVPYRWMDLPIDPAFRTSKAGGRQYQDDVVRAGALIGSSTARVYSLSTRAMISTGCIDVAHAQEGSEVAVLWGEPADRQREIRAVVARYPHLSLPSNATLDIAQIPCIRHSLQSR